MRMQIHHPWKLIASHGWHWNGQRKGESRVVAGTAAKRACEEERNPPALVHRPVTSSRTFIFSLENAVCKDSDRRHCRE